MFIKSLQIGLMGFLLCAATAWAGPASIQGVVKDAKGQPIKGADVRVESRDGKQLFNTVKTDTKGATGCLPGCASGERRRKGVHHQHEDQVRSGNATEL